MPGTIQVSVLDLLDFPSSSSSTTSIKVSMGKREYQTWDTGDFSFPLTTLRENIVVTIQDAEGKELSRTGVETISVVEKGIVEDFFVLEGGGRLHMKLQFILNNVERKRIQELREIALKKKQDELLIDRARRSESAALASFRSNAGSSSPSLNHEVTESLVPMEAESKDALSGSLNEDGVAGQLVNPLPIPFSQIKDSIPGTGDGQEPIRRDTDGKGGYLSTILLTEEPQNHHAKAGEQDRIKSQVPPLDVSASSAQGTLSTILLSEELPIRHSNVGEEVIDKIVTPLTSVDTPISSGEGISSTVLPSEELQTSHDISHENVIEKNETGIPPEHKSTLPPAEVPAGPISSKEELDSSLLEHSVSSKFEEDLTALNKNRTLESPADIPVRRISSLKDMGIHSNSSKFGEVKMLNKSKMLVPPTDVPLRRISSHGDFGDHSRSSKLEEDGVMISEKPNVTKRTPSNVRKMISAFETSQTKGPAVRADPPIIRTQPIKSKFNISQAEPTAKEVMKYSNRTKEEPLQQRLNYIRERKHGGLENNGSPVGLEQQQSSEADTSPSQMPAATRLSETDQHPNIAAQLNTYPFGSSGNCVLVDELMPLCITTGPKKLMHLVGGSNNFPETDRREKSSYQTDATNEDTCNEVNENGKDPGHKRKSEIEGPFNGFEGLIGQAGKIAAMVAFGALVIFARER